MATPSLIASLKSIGRILHGAPILRALCQKGALACEESRSAWDAVTSHQVRASNLPLIYVDVILKLISQTWKALYEDFGPVELLFVSGKALFKWEQLHYDLVGRFIEKLMVMLRSSTMQAEEDVFKQTEAVERMYEAEVQDRVPRRGFMSLELEDVPGFLRASTSQESLEQCFSAISTLLYAVVVSSMSLLVFVYRYLTGYVDRGGTLTCSSGSSQFRAIFMSVVLFDGAYVWIKFRDVVSRKRGGKGRSRKKGEKFEARYTPPGQSGDHLYLGMCRTDEEAAIMKQIAAFLYWRDEGQLALGGGRYFQVPLTLRKEEEGLKLENEEEERLKLEKRKWVREIVRVVYKFFAFVKAIDPASLHPFEDNAKYFSFVIEHLLETPAEETWVPDAVLGSEDVCNGAATSNELWMGQDCVVQKSAVGERATVNCFLSDQKGVQNSDLAASVGVNFGMALTGGSIHDEFAMIPSSLKDEEIQELKSEILELNHEIQETKQTMEKQDQTILGKDQTILEKDQAILEKDQAILKKDQINLELEQKISELEQRVREQDRRIAESEPDDLFSGALPWVDPEMMEFDLDVPA